MSRLSLIAGGTCGSNASIHEGRPRLTTSFGIIRNNDGIIIDQGSGVQNVAKRLLQDGSIERLFILQTHLHDDHVNGLTFNSLLFQKRVPVVGIWAPICEEITFNRVWQDRFAPQNWPVRPDMFGINVPETLFGLDLKDVILPLGITAMRLNHPGGSVAYRIPHEKGDIVIATDHEPSQETNARYASFVSGAQMLVADVQYRQDEYEGKVGINGGPAMKRVGWGHATPELLAKALAGCTELPKELLITHHDPARSKGDLWAFEGEVYEVLAATLGPMDTVLAEDDTTYSL